jgi:CHAD domain-containing protein
MKSRAHGMLAQSMYDPNAMDDPISETLEKAPKAKKPPRARKKRKPKQAAEAKAPVEFPLGQYVDQLVETLRTLIPAALDQWDEQAIHQARVSTRRLKAALDLMEPVLSKQHRKPLLRVLRSLRRRLGPLRDLDVMIGHLEEFNDDPKQGPAAQWLMSRLQPQREQVRKDMKEQPSSAKMLAKLGAWWGVRHEMYEARDAAASLLGESLHQQVDRFADEAAALGRKNAQTGEFQDPHELRITGKALRYTLEMAAEQGHPLPGSVRKAFKRMQESLGLWHDYVVLSETAVRVWLDEELPLHDAAMGGQVLELARVVLKSADHHLTRFQRQWGVAGEKVATCIREMFPLTQRTAPAPEAESQTSPAETAPADATSSDPAAEAPAAEPPE